MAKRIPKAQYRTAANEREDSIDPRPVANRRSGVGRILFDHELEEAYLTSATAARIVSCVADEIFRCGFDLEVADGKKFDDKTFRSRWDTLKASKVITEAHTWARLTGGGAVMIMTPAAESQPFNAEAETIDMLRALSRTEMRVYPGFESVFDDNDFGMPKMWGVDPLYGGTDIQVDNSRLIKLSGRPIPPMMRKNMGATSQRYFGLSCLQGILQDIYDFDDCHEWASLLLKRLQQLVYKTEGAGDQCESRSGRNALQAKVDFADGVRSAKSTMAIDKDTDDVALLNGSLQGVKDVLDTKKAKITQSSGIPQIILAGDTSGGMNNSGESAMQAWQDYIAREQENVITPVVSSVISAIMPELTEFSIKWRPLAEETLQQLADRLFKMAQADTLYIEKYGLTVDEVRDTMRKRGDYVMGSKAPVPPLPVEPSPDEEGAARGNDTTTTTAND